MNDDLMISGSWINKRTGEKVIIRNSIIDGDDMILITDKGQLSMTEFSNNYIQVSDEIYDEKNNVIGKDTVNVDDFVINTNYNDDLIYTDDSIYMNKNVKNEVNNNKIEIELPKEPQAYTILDKFFNKIEHKEDLIQISIDFNIWPKNELKTIIDYLDISLEDLSKYISEKLISYENISKIIFNKLNDEYFEK